MKPLLSFYVSILIVSRNLICETVYFLNKAEAYLSESYKEARALEIAVKYKKN